MARIPENYETGDEMDWGEPVGKKVLTNIIPIVILPVFIGGAKMPNVKTAISIEKPIFEQMDMLAKNLKISRSRLFTLAAREFLERHNNLELLKLINEAYVDSSETEPMVTRMHSNHYRMVKDQW